MTEPAVCRAGCAAPVGLPAIALPLALVLVAAVAAIALAGPSSAAAAARPPAVSAPAAIVVEASTGDVAYRLNSAQRRPIASTTKLMTALLTLRRARLDETFVAPPYSPAPAESRINLRTGESLTVRDLLRALLLASANDAAVTLARGVAGTTEDFVGDMNRQARRLGLRDTSYANPIGLDDPANYSTARDLAALALALRRSAFVRRTTDLERATLRSGARVRRIVNRNELVRKEGWVDGVKTGYTSSAGYVLVGSATRGPVTVVSVVLGEPSEAARNRDSLSLLRYGLSRYRPARPVRRGEVLARPAVRLRGGLTVPVVAARSSSHIVRRGRKVTARERLPSVLEGPLPAGRRVGTVLVRSGRRVIDRVALVTGAAVPAPSSSEGVKQAVGPWVALGAAALLLLLAAGSLLLVQARRRRRRVQDGRRAKARARRRTPA
ncbi:MAG: D-alanyl-D-alanine carboxypeptidase family protein [Solirubrobacteraceae bacterium]